MLGVTDDGRVVGQDVTTRTQEEVVQALRAIEPAISCQPEKVELENGRSVLVLSIPGGTDRPYTYDGRPYRRQGPTTSVMPRSEYEHCLLERLHPTRRWENESVAQGVGLADLDAEEIQRTVNTAISLGRLAPITDRSLEPVLRGLGLIVEDQVLNAAVVLYGSSQRVQVEYPQLSIRLARFRGMNVLADFADNRQYSGHAFSLLRRAESFLLDHVPIAGRVVSGKMVREDHPLYPPRATREALANALCHRDYAGWGGAVSVAMYDDRLEIVNPGGLHFGLTPDNLTQPHRSLPWNPIIAGVFYRAGVIESWGTGTLNILYWCREGHCPDPTWEERTESVWVSFYPSRGFELQQQEPESQPESQPESLSVRVLRVLVEGPLGKSEISARLGQRAVSGPLNATLRQHLAKGLVEYTVPDKPQSRLQRYRLTAKGMEWLEEEGK